MSTLSFNSSLVDGTFPGGLKRFLHYAAIPAEQLKEYHVSLAARIDGLIDLVIVPEDPSRHPYIMPVGSWRAIDLHEDGSPGMCELKIEASFVRLLLFVVDPQRANSSYWKYEDWYTLEEESN